MIGVGCVCQRFDTARQVPLYDDTGYPVATAFMRKHTIQIDNHARDTKLQASGIAQAVPFFRSLTAA